MTEIEAPEREEQIPVSFSADEVSHTFEWLYRTALGVAALLTLFLIFS